MMPRLLFIITYFVAVVSSLAQKASPSLIDDNSRIPVISLQLPDKEPNARMDQKHDPRLKKKVFAQLINTAINPEEHGIWTRTENMQIWSVGIRSENASSLNFLLEHVEMHGGAKLYFFDRDHNHFLGPYTRHDRTEYQTIMTTPIPKDLVYLEYQVPRGQQRGSFQVSRVGHGLSSMMKDARYQQSGFCHPDVNCFSDARKQEIKQGVVRILINNNEYCSGVLINNTIEDGKAYVLTANHCIDSPNKARNSLFHFGYESPYCNGPDATFKTIVGSELVATTDNLDFALVELTREPDFLYHPYFAGWNSQPIIPQDVYTIHHPQGDVKKVAIDKDELVLANFGAGYDDRAHWYVENWEDGSTEHGSSGCALFNSDGQVVGMLSGGVADCDNPISDYFQRFDQAWDKYPDDNNQLKAWLDPGNTGRLSLNGYNPYDALTRTADTLSNMLDTEPEVIYGDDDWGYITGHSSTGNVAFAEQFSIDTDRMFFGVIMNVAKAWTWKDSSKVNVKIWDGTDQPGQLIAEQEYLLDYFLKGESIFIQWDNPVPLDSGQFFVGYELDYNSPLDTFAVFHSPPRDASVSNTAFANGGTTWQPMDFYYPDANIAMDIQPIVFDSLPVKVVKPFEDGQETFRLRPVPAKNKITIDLEDYYSNTVLGKVYNSQGKLMNEFRIEANHKNKELSTIRYPDGIYIISIRINGSYFMKKFSVVK